MFRSIFCLIASLAGSWAGLAYGQAKAAEKGGGKQQPPLKSFIQEVLDNGRNSRIAGPIAELIGVPNDAPTCEVTLAEDQTLDGDYHTIHVMTEPPADSPPFKPLGLVMFSNHRWSGSSESYWFRVSLDGKLGKAILIHGKLDEQGKAIKGSGAAAEKDINSPEIKERFQHEMDLWLKRAHVKKEWRAAEFFQGDLKRKAAPKPGPAEKLKPAR